MKAEKGEEKDGHGRTVREEVCVCVWGGVNSNRQCSNIKKIYMEKKCKNTQAAVGSQSALDQISRQVSCDD